MLSVLLNVYGNKILYYDSVWVCFLSQILRVKLHDDKWEINEYCLTAKMVPLFLFLGCYFVLSVVLSVAYIMDLKKQLTNNGRI